MIVTPYRRNPEPPTIALLTPDARAVSEHGELLDLDDWPAETRLWASYATVYQLVREGRGEALCWNHEEIRWRHRRFEDGWTGRRSDASVVKLPFEGLPLEKQLEGFSTWRDWLAIYGASPTGTSGSAAWSLLRATLPHRLATGMGERPPVRWTTGGRQELGPGGPGRFEGSLAHVDLPAAYASTLAQLRYGGLWTRWGGNLRDLDRYLAGDEHPVFVRAKIRLVDRSPGPLVKRPRKRPRSYMESVLLGNFYPADGRVLQGAWTLQELLAAEAHGARVLKVLDIWVHRSGWFPFRPWWEAVQAGRRLPGLPGALAKVTGNALWGRFALDASGEHVRSIRSLNGELRARKLPVRPQPWPAHDLAETVSGRIRAKLYDEVLAGRWEELVCAHTDGAWLLDEREGPSQAGSGSLSSSGWRDKERASRLDVLDSQRLRIVHQPPAPWDPEVKYAGVPSELAGPAFAEAWERAGYAA